MARIVVLRANIQTRLRPYPLPMNTGGPAQLTAGGSVGSLLAFLPVSSRA